MNFKTRLLSLFSAFFFLFAVTSTAMAQDADGDGLTDAVDPSPMTDTGAVVIPDDDDLDDDDLDALDDAELGAATRLEQERVPGWTLEAGYLAQDLGFRNESARGGDYDFRGIDIAAGRDSKISTMMSTTSKLHGNYSVGESEVAGIEDDLGSYSVGYEQTLNYDLDLRNTLVRPFVGFGAGLGRFDRAATTFADGTDDDDQRNFLRGALTAGANVTLPNGVKPFVKYEWSVAELNEDAALDFGDVDNITDFTADMSANTIVAGLGYNF